MKLSVDTVNILKNFSLINPSIAFKAGNSLATMSPQKSVMARADLDDHFPSDGAIYDLSRFLGVISLFETPSYNFKENLLEISGDGKSVSYTFADPSIAAPVSSNATSIFSFVDGDGSLAGASPFAPELPPTIELQRMRLESDV